MLCRFPFYYHAKFAFLIWLQLPRNYVCSTLLKYIHQGFKLFYIFSTFSYFFHDLKLPLFAFWASSFWFQVPYPLTTSSGFYTFLKHFFNEFVDFTHSVPLFCNVSLPSPSLLYPLCLTTSLFILWMECFFHMPFLSRVTASVKIVFVILTTIPLKASQNSWCSFQTSLEKHVSRGMFKCGSYLIHWLQVISL